MWLVSKATEIGSSHLKANLPCQDKLDCRRIGSDVLIAVIADGAGTAEMAEQGAEIAVNSVIQYCDQEIEKGSQDYCKILYEAAEFAREAIFFEAEFQQVSVRQFASTLLALIVSADEGAALQIGDGVIIVNNSGWNWVFWPQRGEYANTTYFLTDDDALAHCEKKAFSGHIQDIAMVSDGLESLVLLYKDKTVYEPFFESIFPRLRSIESERPETSSELLKQWLSSDHVKSRTDDDVSIILATCQNNS